MGQIQAIIQAFLSQLNGPFLLGILSLVAIFGLINELMADGHHRMWTWLLRFVLWGAFVVGAAQFVQSVMA